ncbi:MAG: leucine-rich repeat domain-containing protein [Bacteroidota bacterium]
MKLRKVLLLVFIFLFVGFSIEAQQKKKPASKQPAKTNNSTKKTPAKSTTKTQPAPQTKKEQPKKQLANEPAIDAASGDEKRVRDIISFLEFVLNTLGSESTPARDKETVITESYAKIFRDAKVQVEDDLDATRNVITNKDVTAYLKDVNFFFKNVKFTFEIDGIQTGEVDGKKFYKVSATRNLSGTSADGEAVNNNSPRYIEVNYDPATQDLKIVSIYTKGFDEKQAMVNWWNQMSYEWQSLFRKISNKTDSVGLSDIRQMSAITEINISNNQYIQNIEPLARLTNLQKLNISGTKISDLTPIRNLTELQEVDLSRSAVKDIAVLKYASKISKLNLENTGISDLSVVKKMTSLQVLNARGTKTNDLTGIIDLTTLTNVDVSKTQITSLAPFQNLTAIQVLDVSSNAISDLAPLTNLKALVELNIDSTNVINLIPLAQLGSLNILSMNNTKATTLDPLKGLPKLQKIYCDHTPIRQEIADSFMAAKKGTLVVFDSKDLKSWWETLSKDWQNILYKASREGRVPSKDELAILANVDSINLNSSSYINDLEPLKRLPKLEVIIASKTGIKDLSAIKDHREVRYLDISDTDVSDVSVLSKFAQLKTLKADRSKIQDIDPLIPLASLSFIYADDTGVNDIRVSDFIAKNPRVLIVYKTFHVERWWGRLAPEWRTALEKQVKVGDNPSREILHKLVEQRTLNVGDANVSELSSLGEFVRLEELGVSGTSIVNLSTLSNLSIRSLHITNSPLQTLEGIAALPDLIDLDISNTPITDLRPLSKLNNLAKFSCAGTQVRKLDALEILSSLEYLDCSNTSVNRLDGVFNLPLKNLKCYNTKLSNRQVDKFKQAHTDCQVVYY